MYQSQTCLDQNGGSCQMRPDMTYGSLKACRMYFYLAITTVVVVTSFLPERNFEESHCILKAVGLVGQGDGRYWTPKRRSRYSHKCDRVFLLQFLRLPTTAARLPLVIYASSRSPRVED